MANKDRVRKLLVRTAFVTSATLATLVGAQNLAMLDARQIADLVTPTANTTTMVPPNNDTLNPSPVAQAAPQLTIIQAAPSITILRQSGQGNGSVASSTAANSAVTAPATTANGPNIQPPDPQQITAPQPIIIEQPVQQNSRSSR